jgi:hypothetical protein
MLCYSNLRSRPTDNNDMSRLDAVVRTRVPGLIRSCLGRFGFFPVQAQNQCTYALRLCVQRVRFGIVLCHECRWECGNDKKAWFTASIAAAVMLASALAEAPMKEDITSGDARGAVDETDVLAVPDTPIIYYPFQWRRIICCGLDSTGGFGEISWDHWEGR